MTKNSRSSQFAFQLTLYLAISFFCRCNILPEARNIINRAAYTIIDTEQ